MTVATTPKLTEQEAIELSNEIIRLEAVIKTMKEKLKQYVEDNGDLIAGDIVWKFQEVESWEFRDSEKIKEFLKSLVIDGYTTDPFSVVSISKTKIRGLDDSYLSNFATKKVTKRFVNRKV